MTARTAASPATSTLPAWAALCFFASGAAGLLYEIVWSKQLAYLLGGSLHAVATVTAAFLCGLALGARVLGVPLARRGDGARTYALLELGVAALGAALLPALRALEPVFGHFYRALGGESAGFAAVRFVLTFAVLLPPTVLMGATLPVLVARFERDLVGPALARLYALNTFGAVAGSALGGFVLMPGLGLARSTAVAAALNVAVAVIALLASRSPRAAVGAAAGTPAAAPSAAAPAGDGVLVAVLFAASGFAALVFQIAWVRLFSLVFGSSVYSFAGVLGVYLLGLALGSAIAAPWLRRGVNLASFAWLQLALALAAALALHGFSRLPDGMFDLVQRSRGEWGVLFAGQLGLVALLVAAPCALLGAVFPVAARLLQRGESGAAAGDAYLVNTAGTITGSIVAGFVLVPTLGVQGTHLFALALSGLIGLVALARAHALGLVRGAGTATALAAAAAALAIAWAAPAWDPALMSVGSFRPQRANELAILARSQAASGVEGTTARRAALAERVLYYEEGVNGSVLVGTNAEGDRRWLKVGGKVDASTDDMETQVLLGLLPAALADSGARSLVIGLGSGYTLAAALAAGVGRTDVVELEQGVVEASEFFYAPDGSPLRDPRVKLTVGDARTLLVHSRERYGLIISEPSNPWLAGVNNLFTVDFYRRVRDRLEPDGVFCQWMQLYEISPGTIRSMLASFLEVFPEGDVYTVWRNVDVLLVAAPRSRGFALDRLRGADARAVLDAAHIAAPEDLAAYWSAPLSALTPLVRGAELNRDDLPHVEYRAPRDLVTVGRAALEGARGATRLVPLEARRPAGARFAAWPPEDWYARRMKPLGALGDTARARVVLEGARAEGLDALAARLEQDFAAGARRRAAELAVEEARRQLALGRRTEARLQTERATKLDPGYASAWLMLADQRRVAGELAGAAEALARVPAGQGAEVDADAAILSGLVALARRDTAVALARYADAQALRPGHERAWMLEIQVHLKREDLAATRRAVERALAAIPGHAELERVRNVLGP